jgi:hypothetical protein
MSDNLANVRRHHPERRDCGLVGCGLLRAPIACSAPLLTEAESKFQPLRPRLPLKPSKVAEILLHFCNSYQTSTKNVA